MSNVQYHVLEIPLNFSHKELQYWNKIFKIAWQCYSCLYDEIHPIIKQHKQTKSLNLKELKLREYDLHHRIVKYKHNYEQHLDITISQKIASQLSKGIQSVTFKKGKELRKNKWFQFNSIEGKSNTTGLRVISKNNKYYFKYKGFIKKLSFQDSYQIDNFQFEHIKYCRLIRRQFRRNYKYYLQIIISGTSSKKKLISKHKAGCDLGVNGIALVRDDMKCKLLHTGNATYHQERIAKLQRILAKAYDEKNWGKIRYLMRIISCLRRKQAMKHRYEINKLTKEILSFAGELISEDMDFKKIRQTKEYKGLTKIIQFCTPGLLKSKIEENVELKFVDKYNYRASQYNHLTNTYIKPKLSERTKTIGNNKTQRDLYSAYLLLNHNEDYKEIDRKKCIDNFNTFLENHNQLISTLKQSGLTYPKSFGLESF